MRYIRCLIFLLLFFVGLSAFDIASVQGQGSQVLYRVLIDGKIGFIDSKGKLVIKTQFDDFVSDFSEGLAEFKDRHALPKYPFSKSGYIDTKGKIVIKPRFDVAYDFSNGRAQVKNGDLTSFIDKTGEEVIKLEQYQGARSFQEGLAAILSNWEFWYIDTSGSVVIQRQRGLAKDFSEGLACVYIPVAGQLRAGYIDKTGKMIVSPQFDDCYDFSEGLAIVELDGKFGYIDKSGDLAIKPAFTSAYDFSNGRARVSSGEKLGFIDREGRHVIPEEYDIMTGDFSEGLAAVCSNDMCGYMDIFGKWLIKPKYRAADEFRGGLAMVQTSLNRGYINKRGKYIWYPSR